MLDYIQYTGIARGYSRQRILQWNLTGEAARLPAGPLSVAAGLSSRREAGAYLPDPMTASGNTTGSKAFPTEGSYSVRELYAETRLPLYEAGVVRLDATAAGRTFHYDSFGWGFTHEAGGHLQLPRGLAFRATSSNAFRAPGISEMFLGASDSFPLVSDPCSRVDEAGKARQLTEQQQRNCAAAGIPEDFEDSRAQLLAQLGGSTDLDPEKAAMITAGVVYQPGFLEGFDLTVDYYTTRIEDEIGALPAGLILSNCYSQEEPSNCGQVVRDPDNHLIERILAANANIGETETSGVDFGLDYAAGTPLGIVSAQLESNMLVRYQTLPSAGGPELVRGKGYYDLGVFPAWRHAASVGLAKGRFSTGLTWRYVGGFEECEDDDCKGKYRRDVEKEPRSRKVDSNSTFNLCGSYELRTGFGRSVVTVGGQQPVRPAAGGDLQRVPRHLRRQHLRLHGPVPLRPHDPVPVVSWPLSLCRPCSFMERWCACSRHMGRIVGPVIGPSGDRENPRFSFGLAPNLQRGLSASATFHFKPARNQNPPEYRTQVFFQPLRLFWTQPRFLLAWVYPPFISLAASELWRNPAEDRGTSFAIVPTPKGGLSGITTLRF